MSHRSIARVLQILFPFRTSVRSACITLIKRYAAGHRGAALPQHTTVRLRLTVPGFLRFLGGYASNVLLIMGLLTFFPSAQALAKKRVPPGGRVAVVVDERLAALRTAPDLRARLISRLSRARLVSIRGEVSAADGLKFYRVATSRRTSGWLQIEAVVAPWHPGDDRRLLALIESSEDFDRIVRARSFVDTFPRSPLVPKVLALYAREADDVAEKLSQAAQRRFTKNEIPPDGAPEFSYYLNYSSLDRYNREGVTFLFDRVAKKYKYDGLAWRELVRRYPRSPEAQEARKHLEAPGSRQSP
jgi:hypothetical protein